MEKQENEKYEAEAVDPGPYPDMLVLGFQELDLSTEALLYSTSTVREHAWSVAIFAALGEKAVLYEKVGFLARRVIALLNRHSASLQAACRHASHYYC